MKATTPKIHSKIEVEVIPVNNPQAAQTLADMFMPKRPRPQSVRTLDERRPA